MARKVKRFVALIVAGILLVCAAFASLAEGMTEGTEIPAETEAIETSETAETVETIPETNEPEEVIPEPEVEQPSVEPETSEPESVPELETVEEPVAVEPEAIEPENIPEPETATQPDHEETAEAEINDDDCFIFEEQDAGSVDPELMEILIPNGGAPVTIDDDDAGTVESGLVNALFPNGGAPTAESTESTEHAEAKPAESDVESLAEQLRIALDNGQTIRVGEQTALTAQPESEITGVVTWEILDESQEEEVWVIIGLGKRLVLDITEEILNKQIRFVLEDGRASEIFVLTETEEQEEPVQKTEEQTAEKQGEEEPTETTGISEEQTEVENSEETAETPAGSENEDDVTVIEVPAEEPIRAWISAETTNETEETEEGIGNTTLILTAEADVELDESIVWQMKAADDAEWKNIWYGKTASIEMTEENADSVIRFRTSDGVFSEEFRLTVQEAEVEETEIKEPEGEEQETETEEIGIDKQENEEPESKEDEEQPVEEAFALPEERSVTFTITGDGEALRLGDVAHFNAELTGYEGLDYILQWQMSTDNENWEDIPDANEPQMDLVLTEENSRLFWRVTVMIHMPKSVETQPDEVAADDGVPAEEALPDKGQTGETQSDETQPNEMQINDAQNDKGSED